MVVAQQTSAAVMMAVDTLGVLGCGWLVTEFWANTTLNPRLKALQATSNILRTPNPKMSAAPKSVTTSSFILLGPLPLGSYHFGNKGPAFSLEIRLGTCGRMLLIS